MAKKPKKEKTVVADKDHPSLIEVGGRIRLRVLEDFYIERELPKWKRFTAEWDKFREMLGLGLGDLNEEELKKRVADLKDKSDEEKDVIIAQAKNLIAMNRAVHDDRWGIQSKHEKEVDMAVLKQAKFVAERTVWDRIKDKFSRRKRHTVPVEIAMVDLFDHIELTSTPELAARMERLNEVEASMRKAGQYKKADMVKQLKTIVAEEAVVVAAGFTSYLPEDTMIEFLRKSERGTMVEFLRYYEDEMPMAAIEKKLEADKLMVFDNYVVAHYSDLIQKAANIEKKAGDEEEKKQREKRRDPILFGVIKNSRKLYYICDWKTDTDDLTLEKLEDELGVTRGSLVKGAETASTSVTQYDEVAERRDQQERRMREIVYDTMVNAMDDVAEMRSRSYDPRLRWDRGTLSFTQSY